MIKLQDIFDDFELTSKEVEGLTNEAKLIAIGIGTNVDNKALSEKTWTLFDDISDSVWYSEMAIADKINLGFQLYHLFPSYYHFLVPFYHLIRNKETDQKDLKNKVWENLMFYLGSEDFYADPVKYVLWVEFFEDSSTVEETWKGLMNYPRNNQAVLRLIEKAGPVPFELKYPLYEKLLKDEMNHKSILKSLLFSAYDVYGIIDIEKTRVILPKLNIEGESEDYRLLLDKINNTLPNRVFKK
jgi:hypothetical protein